MLEVIEQKASPKHAIAFSSNLWSGYPSLQAVDLSAESGVDKLQLVFFLGGTVPIVKREEQSLVQPSTMLLSCTTILEMRTAQFRSDSLSCSACRPGPACLQSRRRNPRYEKLERQQCYS